MADRLTNDESQESRTPTKPRRFICERCGGSGVQPDGCYDLKTRTYTSPAGVCQLCDGEGLLGEMPKSL